MIIFLYGEDSYRIAQKLKELVSAYKAKNPSGLNFISLDFFENNTDDLMRSLASNSFIPEKKLIVVKNIFKTNPELLLEFLKSQKISLSEGIILVAISFGSSAFAKATADKKNELFKYLIKKPNLTERFEYLKPYEVKTWVRDSLRQSGVEIAGEALDFLILNCGHDSWRIDGEIKKLMDYKNTGVIMKSEVEKLIATSANYNVFELTDALANKNKKRALLALHKALDNGEKPSELLGMIAWQIRNLLRFKLNSSQVSGMKLHPFVLEKLKESVKLFSLEELNRITSKIINLDFAFKTSDMNEKTAFSLLIAEL
ncbi:MAG: DNA polymerase III subunit delta [Candidatus Azambacteria bacterium]|nr:DNA polymerase III subunit delta [Candidatus Azambacteria bacterium]